MNDYSIMDSKYIVKNCLFFTGINSVILEKQIQYGKNTLFRILRSDIKTSWIDDLVTYAQTGLIDIDFLLDYDIGFVIEFNIYDILPTQEILSIIPQASTSRKTLCYLVDKDIALDIILKLVEHYIDFSIFTGIDFESEFGIAKDTDE